MLTGGLRSGLVLLMVVTALLSGAVVSTGEASPTTPVDNARVSGRAERSAVSINRAGWYVGVTSAGTRIDFRTSPSGAWVRDFHFGSPELTRLGLAGQLMPDGNFPLSGLPISHGGFTGNLEARDATGSNADATSVAVTGRFINQQHVTGTLQAEDRSGAFDPLTFTATRARSLPAPPTKSGRYFGLPLSGPDISFTVSRSGRRVTAFRIASTLSECKYSDRSAIFTLVKSYPVAGLRQDSYGTFGGVVSSRITARGRPAGTRVQVSLLFLSPTEATGTLRLLGGGTISTRGSSGGKCGYETLPFRAAISTEIVRAS